MRIVTIADRFSRGAVASAAFATCFAVGVSLIWLTGSDRRSNVPAGLVSSALVGWLTFHVRSGRHRTNE
jgi:hypothetical protein